MGTKGLARDMALQLNPADLISQAFVNARKAFVAGSPWMGALVLLTIAPDFGLELGAFSWIYVGAVFAVGVALSLTVYRAMIESSSGSFLQLAHANLSVYAVFLFIGVCAAFFWVMMWGIFLEGAGYASQIDQNDTEAVLDATVQMLPSAYGVALVLVTLALIGGLSWLALRLLTYGATTMASGQTHVFRTWSFAKGHLRPLALAAMVTHVLPFLAAVGLSLAIPEMSERIRIPFCVALLYPFLLLGHGLAVAAHKHLAPAER